MDIYVLEECKGKILEGILMSVEAAESEENFNAMTKQCVVMVHWTSMIYMFSIHEEYNYVNEDMYGMYIA